MNCKTCKKPLEGKRKAYCNENCRYEWYKYYKPYEPLKRQRNEGFYQEYTTNYGRKKGVRGSGGWGVGPNVVWFWTELTAEKLKNKGGLEKIKLGSMRIVTVEEALKLLNK